MPTLSGEFSQVRTPHEHKSTPGRKILRTFAIALLLFGGIFVFNLILRPANRDYISYWSAANLFVHHANPYSPSGVLALEKAQGDLHSIPGIMRNPPWAMFLVAPLALGGPFVTLFFWNFASVSCILIFANLLDVPSRDRAFAYVFAPTISCVIMGQSSAFLLLGFALFLYFKERHPFLSGSALLLMAFKPHLFLIFWAVLLAESLYQRRLHILSGLAAALTAATAFALSIDPQICHQYLDLVRTPTLQNEFFPTLSMLFRILINRGSIWLLFVPSALGILWGLWYYLRHRRVWDWRVHGMLLMLVTVTVSPYGGLEDGVVLLPSIAFALASPVRRRFSAEILMAINTITLVILLVVRARMTSTAYVWFFLAILLWFFYAIKQPHSASARLEANEQTP